MAYFEVKRVCKSFGKTKVLNGIDFSMEKGQVLSIIGSSGSGKTTLLRCLNFLETPDSGEIFVDGDCIFDSADTSKKSFAEIREKRLSFGLVFQSFHLFPQYSVLGNLTLAPKLRAREDAKKNKLSAADLKNTYAEIDAKADALLCSVGLSDKRDAYPCQLSGGQQQRVSIARALAKNPKLLLCDEPTGALDYVTGKQILKLLQDTSRKTGMTVVIITHNSALTAMADRVIKVKNGTVVDMRRNENATPVEEIEW